MAPSPISFFFVRRISLSLNPKSHRLRQPFLGLYAGTSLSTSTQQNPSLDPTPKPSSLSARLSFVFDQIDAIEKQQSEQDETLERIRAWRQSKQTHHETTAAQRSLDSESGESAGIDANSRAAELAKQESGELRKEKGVVELVHPWPEWMELMERLVQQNYFDHRRRDEDKMVQSLGIDVSDVMDGRDGGDGVGIALFQDFKTVQTACVNFGKDRFDILRSLSRHDIQILVGHGCPTTDRKVVFSGKLLRKHVHLDEGDVCSSCSLRNSCEKAFLLTNKEDEARTVDIMRILFTYGFDPLNGSVANKDLLKQKSVKTVVRKLLHEIVKLSAVPIDPNLPPPVIKKPSPKVKQPPPPPKKRVGRDDVEMKKGDWLCPKCDFMNFAKNTVCLQCDAKRPKRQLLPGEWECPECNFLNYRRNMACFHCDCKRPLDEFIENKAQEKLRGVGMGTEKVEKRKDVSGAWNFDFDDDESDGADVAAFEYADSTLKDKNSPSDAWAPREDLRDREDEFGRHRGARRFDVRESSDLGRSVRPGIGFDDFDDEDDIDSYEIDKGRDRDVPKASSSSSSSHNFSDLEGFSESEADIHAHQRTSSKLNSNQNKPRKSRAAFSDDDYDELGFDTDDEVSATSKWKSSHVASAHKNQRGGSSKKLSFGSDEEFGFDSDIEDDDPEEKFKGRRRNNGGRGGFKSKGSSLRTSESDDDEEEDYNDMPSSANRSRRNRRETPRFKGTTRNNRPAAFGDEFDRASLGRTWGNDRRSQESNKGQSRQRKTGRASDSRNFRGFENRNQNNDRDRDYREFRNRRQGSDSRNFGGVGNRFQNNDRDRDNEEFRNSRRVIER